MIKHKIRYKLFSESYKIILIQLIKKHKQTQFSLFIIYFMEVNNGKESDSIEKN